MCVRISNLEIVNFKRVMQNSWSLVANVLVTGGQRGQRGHLLTTAVCVLFIAARSGAH